MTSYYTSFNFVMQAQHKLAEGITVEDFLYLPSHLTAGRRENMIKMHGNAVVRIDRDVSLLQFRKDCCLRNVSKLTAAINLEFKSQGSMHP